MLKDVASSSQQNGFKLMKLFSKDMKFLFHSLCLQGSSLGMPKQMKIKEHAEYSVNFAAIFAPLCSCEILFKKIVFL